MDKCLECKGPVTMIGQEKKENQTYLSFYCSKCEIIYNVKVQVQYIMRKCQENLTKK